MAMVDFEVNQLTQKDYGGDEPTQFAQKEDSNG
jgi:hypothetical protein